jgi:hypothetical protein
MRVYLVSNRDDSGRGHNPQDYQPFENIFDDQDRLYTNTELVQLLSPYNVSQCIITTLIAQAFCGKPFLPYVYDTFEWYHCQSYGLDYQLIGYKQ